MSEISHLNTQNRWVKCLCNQFCRYGTQVNESPEVLNSLPLSWLELTYFGRTSEVYGGDRSWYKNDQYHRENGPALVTRSRTLEWFREGVNHRLDGPAVIYADGTQEWWVNGLRHREDGPALIKSNQTKEWWWEQKTQPDWDKFSSEQSWFSYGKLHRVDAPAVVYANGTREWWVNGLQHRLDGPALEESNGYKEWWEDGVLIKTNQSEFD